MNLTELKLDLDNSRLLINLELYKVIKDVVQTKLTPSQSISLVERLKLIIKADIPFESKKENLLKYLDNMVSNSNSKSKVETLINNTIIFEESLYILKLALNLNRYKDFILEKSKLLAENFRITEGVHILDFSYDYNMIAMPYSVRVAGALLDILSTNCLYYRVCVRPLQKKL